MLSASTPAAWGADYTDAGQRNFAGAVSDRQSKTPPRFGSIHTRRRLYLFEVPMILVTALFITILREC